MGDTSYEDIHSREQKALIAQVDSEIRAYNMLVYLLASLVFRGTCFVFC